MFAALGATSHAAIFSWSGGGSDGNWSDSANWGFIGTPTNGDTIIFSAAQPHLFNTNDIANLTLNQVRFVGGAGGYNIYGNSFTITNSIPATNTAGVNIINNLIILGTNDINITVSNALTLTGSLTGNVGFSKNGSGILTLSGPTFNTYFGATHVNDGLLALSKSGGAYGIGNGTLTVGDGVGAPSSAVVREFGSNQILEVSVVVYGDGEVDLNGNNDIVGTLLSVNDGGEILNSGTGLLALLSGTTIQTDTTNGFGSVIASSVDVGTSSCIVTQSVDSVLYMEGRISGSAAITESGFGQLYLTTSNSFTGPLTINGGVVVVQDSWALGDTNNGTQVNEPGLLAIGNLVNVVGEPLTLNSVTGYLGLGALYDYVGGTNVWGGPVTLGVNAPINVEAGLVLNITGTITGPGGVVVSGPGTVLYSGPASNTYVGLTTVNNGTLALNKAVSSGAIPGNAVVNSGGTLRLAGNEQIADTANVTVNTGGLFDFSTFFESIDTLSGTGNVTFGSFGYLNIGGNGGTSTFNGLMSGTGYPFGYTVGKYGGGTFTMNNNNTYLYGSDVFAGTLIINGSQPQNPVLRFSSGATLGGSGVVGDIGDNPNNASGSIAPGIAGSPAILTCSNLVFDSSGNFTVTLNGPNTGSGYDQLVVRGTNFLGNATLTLLPSFGQPPSINQQFTIINNQGTGLIVGTFKGLPDNSIISAGAYFFRINYNASGGNDVVLTMVGPVPGDTVTIDAAAKGWYDSTGFHDSGIPNYICGVYFGTGYRDFYVFNAPISSRAIINAELIINCYTNESPKDPITYLVRGVSTPIGTLEAGGSGLTGIYLDLGSNTVYAERNISTNESGQFAIIPLNVKFIQDITAAAGGQIALGGTVVGPGATNQTLFVFSGHTANEVQLRLTYGNSVTLNAANTGWYDSTGSHTAANKNYIAGTSGGTYRDYFMYNLPVIAGPLVYAQLLVSNYNIGNPAGFNPYQLYDVSTPITTLTNDAVGATGTYADLGSGVLYGGRDLYVSESGLQSGIPLDGEFVSDVYAHSGSQIALGGAVSSTNGFVFGASPFGGNPANAQLWLGFLSAPATTPVFVDTTNIGNGMVQFTVFGANGTSNEIQGSIDFANWDYMGDLFMTNTTSVFIYTNTPTPATSFPYRFFRAKILP